MSGEHKQRSMADHIWHVWLNKWNRLRGEFDHSMYEFESMLSFLTYGAKLIEKAFTGTLPPEHNTLRCAMGKTVTECEILADIRATFDTERQRECEVLGRRYRRYAGVSDKQMFRVMANTCAWHMYTEPIRTREYIDTTDGWLMDESDRKYWRHLYENMSQSDPEP